MPEFPPQQEVDIPFCCYLLLSFIFEKGLRRKLVAKHLASLIDELRAAPERGVTLPSIVFKEYDCIQVLVAHNVFAWDKNSTLALFQKHFLTRHCLFLSKEALKPLGYHFRLELHQITVAYSPEGPYESRKPSVVEQSIAEEPSSEPVLAAYYLDWCNFSNMTAENVVQHLSAFWTRFREHAQKPQAFEALGLAESASWREVQQCYRRLANTHHPDKGGDADRFNQIQSAYATLKKMFHRRSNSGMGSASDE